MTAWVRWLAWTLGAGALVLGGVTYVNSTAPGSDLPSPIDLTTVADNRPDPGLATSVTPRSDELEAPVAVEPDEEQVVPSSTDMTTTPTRPAPDDDDQDDDDDDD